MGKKYTRKKKDDIVIKNDSLSIIEEMLENKEYDDAQRFVKFLSDLAIAIDDAGYMQPSEALEKAITDAGEKVLNKHIDGLNVRDRILYRQQALASMAFTVSWYGNNAAQQEKRKKSAAEGDKPEKEEPTEVGADNPAAQNIVDFLRRQGITPTTGHMRIINLYASVGGTAEKLSAQKVNLPQKEKESFDYFKAMKKYIDTAKQSKNQSDTFIFGEK